MRQTIGSLLQKTIPQLTRISSSPALDAEVLLGAAIKRDRAFLYTHPEKIISASEKQRFTRFVKSRRRGVPVAYILGHKEFYGLNFIVSPATLIPRPESEWLVERAIEITSRDTGIKNIIDVGTGSGNIIISLAKKRAGNKIKFYAADYSKKALAVAKKNANLNQVGDKIKFFQSDLLKKIIKEKNQKFKNTVIIANLPYLSKTDYKKHGNDLKFEPLEALTDKSTGWTLIKRLLQELPNNLCNVTILLEIGPSIKTPLSDWLKKWLPRASFKFHKDYAGLFRYLEIMLDEKNSKV